LQYRRLGRSGLKVSALSFGTYGTFGAKVDQAGANELTGMAYDAGVNFFDAAEGYAGGEAERLLGRALRDHGWRRDSYAVSSKVFFGTVPEPKPTQRGLCRKHVVEACHQALERLQVDYLDLYFCHRPDRDTPVEETVRAMHDLIQQGKVLYWGTSEWSSRDLVQAYQIADRHHLVPPTMEQPQYNLLNADRLELEYAHVCERYGLGTTIWGPLRAGLLSNKYNDGIPEGSRLSVPIYEGLRKHLETEHGRQVLAVIRELAEVAREAGTTLPRLAIAWCLTNPHVPRRRLYRIPGVRRLHAFAYAVGLR
jgi:voltage-dependent potassium channel beta subunit